MLKKIKELSKPPIRSTLDIKDYNFTKVIENPELYKSIIDKLRNKDIYYLNSILFIDAVSIDHESYINILLDDKRFDINKAKKVFETACYYGNIDIIKILINSKLIINKEDYISALKILISHNESSSDFDNSNFHKDYILNKDISTIKFLISIFNYDKQILDNIFLEIYSFYSLQDKEKQKQFNYLKFIIHLFLKQKIFNNKKIMNKITNSDFIGYNKDLINLLYNARNINNF